MQNRETAIVPYLSPTSDDDTASASTAATRAMCPDPESEYVLPNEYTPKGRNCRAKLMRKLMDLRVTANDNSFEEKAISALLRRLRYGERVRATRSRSRVASRVSNQVMFFTFLYF